MSSLDISLTGFVVFLAFLVRGFTGFGSGLVMMPLLTLFLDLKVALVVAATVSIVNGAALAYHVRSAIEKSVLPALVLSNAFGAAFGAFVVVSVDTDILKTFLGIVVIVIAAKMSFSTERNDNKRKWPSWLAPIVGLSSGILGTTLGSSGPPVIVYLSHRLGEKDILRATLLGYFVLTDIVKIASYVSAELMAAHAGLMTDDARMLCWFAVPASLVGSYIGTRTQGKVTERLFRLSVAGVLIVSGLLLVIR